MTEIEILIKEIGKLREEVRILRSCLKWLILHEKLRGCGSRTDDEIRERLAIKAQLPDLPRSIFDADRIGRDVFRGKIRTVKMSDKRDAIRREKMRGEQ